MATSRFTSSLALPSEHTDAIGSVWIQQDESRQASTQAWAAQSSFFVLEDRMSSCNSKSLTQTFRTICRLLLPEDYGTSSSLQEARRQELTTYLQHLKHKQHAEPSADLTFGTDFYSLVQHLSEQRKTEYKSVRGNAPSQMALQ